MTPEREGLVEAGRLVRGRSGLVAVPEDIDVVVRHVMELHVPRIGTCDVIFDVHQEPGSPICSKRIDGSCGGSVLTCFSPALSA